MNKVLIKDILCQNSDISLSERKSILSFLLNVKNNDLYLYNDEEIKPEILEKYYSITKRLEKEPMQYILKKASFFGNDFYVDKNVLIPRPETEYLIEIVQNYIKKYFSNKSLSILDIGTGSGCIAITLKYLNPTFNVTGIDISEAALEVARKNAINNKTEVKFLKSDLFDAITNKYDIIISNPPYLSENDTFIEKKVKDNEPSLALFGGNDGFVFYKRIMSGIKKYLNKNFLIAFEIGYNQGNEIVNIVKNNISSVDIEILNDLNDFNRYVLITNMNKNR